MSVAASTWAWSAPGDLTPHELLVLVALADYADDRGRAWPSMATLARRCHLHRATIYRILDRLERHHRLISKIRGGGGQKGRSNVYELRMSSPKYPVELSEIQPPLNEVTDLDEPTLLCPQPVAQTRTGRTVRPVAARDRGVAPDATGDVAPDATRPVSEPLDNHHAHASCDDRNGTTFVGEHGERVEYINLPDGRTFEIPVQPKPTDHTLTEREKVTALQGIRAVRAQLAERSKGSDGGGS